MLVLTLLTVNILLLLNRVTDEAIKFVENRIEVSVYFNQTADTKTISDALTYLRTLPQVKDVQEITADDSLALFKTRHAADPAILSSLDELGSNPFGPTLIVKANSAKDFDAIISALNNPQYKDAIREKDFSDYQQIVAKIRVTTDRIRMVGIILSGVFFLIALLIIFNTVRVTVFIHKDEIGIMRLVGASSGFIRAPYLLETILLSFIALVITMAIVFPGLFFLDPYMTQYFGGQSTGLVSYFVQNGLYIFGGQFLALLIVTMGSTSLAIRKYLKV